MTSIVRLEAMGEEVEDSGQPESSNSEECEMLRAQLVMLNSQLFAQRKTMVEERNQTGELCRNAASN